MVILFSTAQFHKQRRSGHCSSLTIQKFGHGDDTAGESTDKHLVSVPSAVQVLQRMHKLQVMSHDPQVEPNSLYGLIKAWHVYNHTAFEPEFLLWPELYEILNFSSEDVTSFGNLHLFILGEK